MKSVFINENSIENIKKKIDEYEYISFDVFDTLIKRNVDTPSDLFELMGLELNREMGISNFAEVRKNAEKIACKRNVHCTINDIYDVVTNEIPQLKQCDVISLEEKYELSYCQTNYLIMDIYKYAKYKGKRIIAISDMYLSKHTIKEILIHNGYSIDELYVSCEEQKNKKNGSLFDIVLKKERILNDKLIHIGDSFKADYLGAKKCGIKSIKIARNIILFNPNRYYREIDEKIKYNVHKSIINNNLDMNKNYYEKFGFSILGPSLFSFCKWIEQQCMTQCIKDVFFFSRDGYIIKRAFDMIKTDEIKSHYLLVSRRSLRVPYNASHSNLDEVIKFFPTTKKINIKILVSYLGLNVDEIQQILDEFEFHKEDIVYYNEINEKYRTFLERLMPFYINKARIELQNVILYLKQEKVSGKIAVVDIGWHNSMQFCLQNILNEAKVENDIMGLYFGIQSNGSNVEKSFSFLKEPDGGKYVDSATAYIGLIESFFLEQEGTVISYEFSSNKYIAQRDVYEHDEHSKEYKSYNQIHNGVLKYIELIKKFVNYDSLALSGRDAYLPIYSFGVKPYYDDISKFDDFRYFSEGIYHLVGYKGLVYYIVHPRALKDDLYNARWKIGFLKKMIKLNIPYYKLYIKLKGK